LEADCTCFALQMAVLAVAHIAAADTRRGMGVEETPTVAEEVGEGLYMDFGGLLLRCRKGGFDRGVAAMTSAEEGTRMTIVGRVESFAFRWEQETEEWRDARDFELLPTKLLKGKL
jgi:hypothetical protein